MGDGDLDGRIDVERRDDLGDLARNFRLMQYKLRTDKLTGLANREAVLNRLAARIQHHRRRADTPGFALLFVDLDGFKSINDRYGHDVGDRVLTALGGRLLGGVRDTDLVARYAGGEFIVLLDGIATPEAADQVRQQLVDLLREPIDDVPSGRLLTVGGSIGVAVFPRDGDSVDGMIKSADEDMYRQKRSIAPGRFSHASPQADV